MKLHAALVSFALALTVSAAQANTHPAALTQARAMPRGEMATRLIKPAPASLALESAPAERHVFPVNDEKGLLLTCVAPEIDINKDTDVFKDCVLAPGRSLDDVMHSFIGAMHEEERKLAVDRTLQDKDAADKAAQKAEQR